MITDPRTLVAVLFLSASLAGCTSGSGDPADADAAGDSLGGNETELSASINVSLEGVPLEPSNSTVDAVVGANLTFQASEADETNLTYSWDFGDGTSGQNATETHAYSAPGVFNVTLDVSDGNVSATASITLNVSTAGPGPGDLIGTQHEEFSGTVPLGNPNAAMVAGVDHQDHVVTVGDADPNGTAGVATTGSFSLSSSSPGAVSMYLYWIGPDGTTLASTSTMSGEATLAYELPMPPGDYVLRVRLFAGAQAAYTATADIGFIAS